MAYRQLVRRLCSNPKRPHPPDPGVCCGMSCVKCVWIDYGNKLVEYYSQKEKHKAIAELERRVSDPNIRAFVITELKMKWK